jgi:hypothetical protein
MNTAKKKRTCRKKLRAQTSERKKRRFTVRLLGTRSLKEGAG